MRGTNGIYTLSEQTSHCGDPLCDSNVLTKVPTRVQGTFWEEVRDTLKERAVGLHEIF